MSKFEKGEEVYIHSKSTGWPLNRCPTYRKYKEGNKAYVKGYSYENDIEIVIVKSSHAGGGYYLESDLEPTKIDVFKGIFDDF